MNKRKVFLLAVCLVFLSVSSYSDTEVGRVLKVKEKVYVIRSREKSDAKLQMPVLLKDTIETDKKSRTKLFFKDNSILNLGELSKVEVEEYLYSPEKKTSMSVYKLIDGYLKVVVGRSDLKIHTSTAIVAARGTEFIVWIGGSGNSRYTGILMLKGEAALKNFNDRIKGIVTVRQGQMSEVFLNKPPERPRPADFEIMNELSGKIDEIQTFSAGPGIKGKIINKSNMNQSTNIAVGEDSESNMGSVVIE